jgi:hypothetical protein
VYLTPEGRRGTVVTHGFHSPQELATLRASHGAAAADDHDAPAMRPAAPAAVGAPHSGGLSVDTRLSELSAEVADLRTQFAELRTQVAGLAEQVRGLREGLGV